MFLQSGKVSEQVGNIEVRDMGTERTDNGIAEGHWRRLHTQRLHTHTRNRNTRPSFALTLHSLLCSYPRGLDNRPRNIMLPHVIFSSIYGTRRIWDVNMA